MRDSALENKNIANSRLTIDMFTENKPAANVMAAHAKMTRRITQTLRPSSLRDRLGAVGSTHVEACLTSGKCLRRDKNKTTCC